MSPQVSGGNSMAAPLSEGPAQPEGNDLIWLDSSTGRGAVLTWLPRPAHSLRHVAWPV